MTDFSIVPLSASYLSTTIPYVNAAPHVGFALELVQTDALARYERLSGRAVFTATGTDDHSLKNVRAAEALGEPVDALVERNARAFAELSRELGVSFDQTVSTSRDPRHAPTVERLFAAWQARGDLYRQRYRGAYCVGCEQFLRPSELSNGVCPEHLSLPEIVEEENWFFRLSRYSARIERAILENRLQILPEERRQEVLAFVRAGLQDFSVSRSAERARGFGIPVPGDPSQVVYVWVDALSYYLTAGDFAAAGLASSWQRASVRRQLLGKGVLRFHAVYWPGLLLSAGLELPDELRVHGYLTVDGKKIGKSAGNGIDPRALLREVGADALRYYLLRHIPPFKDADFSRARLVEAHDSELADELGNLALRIATLTEKSGHVAERFDIGECEAPLESAARPLADELARAFAKHELARAVSAVFGLVRAANRYLDRTEPWRLLRATSTAERDQLARTLAAGWASLRVIALALAPFVPKLAARLATAAGSELGALHDTSLLSHTVASLPLGPPQPLVARLTPRR